MSPERRTSLQAHRGRHLLCLLSRSLLCSSSQRRRLAASKVLQCALFLHNIITRKQTMSSLLCPGYTAITDHTTMQALLMSATWVTYTAAAIRNIQGHVA